MKKQNFYLYQRLLYLPAALMLVLWADQAMAQRAREGNRGGAAKRSTNRASGNHTKIRDNNADRSRDVNINIDNRHVNNNHNTRNTTIRRNSIHSYHHPPYVYGGRRFYAYHPYVYHPFRPFVWGPAWHPWGYFIATLAATAIVVSVNDARYHYNEGVWYTASNGGYIVCAAPVGGSVATIPSTAENVTVNNVTNYYYGGTYYEKDGEQYKVVAPPAGVVVKHLPEGGEEIKVGNQTYVKVGETYYQPVEGEKYEVVQVEEKEQ